MEKAISPADEEWEPEEVAVSGNAEKFTAVAGPVVGRDRPLRRGLGRSSNWSEFEEDSPSKRSRPASSRVPVIGGAASQQETDVGLGADVADDNSDTTVELED